MFSAVNVYVFYEQINDDDDDDSLGYISVADSMSLAAFLCEITRNDDC